MKRAVIPDFSLYAEKDGNPIFLLLVSSENFHRSLTSSFSIAIAPRVVVRHNQIEHLLGYVILGSI